jgi:phosphoglycolate phosphatase
MTYFPELVTARFGAVQRLLQSINCEGVQRTKISSPGHEKELMPPLTRLAVFDVDGTLIDSQHNIVASMVQACERNGIAAPTPEAIRRIIGLSLLEAVTALLPEADPALLPRVMEEYKLGFQELRTRADHFEPLFPGVMEALDSLEADGWLLAVATGKSRRGLLMMIERHGLEGRFVSLQTADDNPGKPHPAMLRRALDEAGARPADAVMIGDTTYDIQMGKSAGVRAVGVGWGYHTRFELMAAGADLVVDDYPHLVGVLPTLLVQAQ